MKVQKVVLVTSMAAVLGLTALSGCKKHGEAKAAQGIENSSGSFAPDTSVPGTSDNSTGVGSTGVPAEDIAKPPSESTVGGSETKTAP